MNVKKILYTSIIPLLLSPCCSQSMRRQDTPVMPDSPPNLQAPTQNENLVPADYDINIQLPPEELAVMVRPDQCAPCNAHLLDAKV